MGYTQVSDLDTPYLSGTARALYLLQLPLFVRNGNYRRYGAPAVPLRQGIVSSRPEKCTNLFFYYYYTAKRTTTYSGRIRGERERGGAVKEVWGRMIQNQSHKDTKPELA